MKERGYSEIATALNTTNASVKTKINGLRGHLGREIRKEKTTKSDQSTDELYKSNWVHYDKLSFLIPVIGTGKSRDTLKRHSLPEDATEKEGETTPVPKKNFIAEKKLELLSKCTDAITSKAAVSSEPPAQKISNFAMYVDKKLSNLDKRSRRIAEKRISDVLFESEMSLDLTEAGEQRNTFGYNCQSLQQPSPSRLTKPSPATFSLLNPTNVQEIKLLLISTTMVKLHSIIPNPNKEDKLKWK